MRRAVTVGLFVLAWMIGPVARVEDGTAPPPTPSETATVGR